MTEMYSDEWWAERERADEARKAWWEAKYAENARRKAKAAKAAARYEVIENAVVLVFKIALCGAVLAAAVWFSNRPASDSDGYDYSQYEECYAGNRMDPGNC
jgi:hypothetical protein